MSLLAAKFTNQGVCPGGCLPRGYLSRGLSACLPEGVGHLPPPLWREFLTHACENINITFPQLRLQTVIIFRLFQATFGLPRIRINSIDIRDPVSHGISVKLQQQCDVLLSWMRHCSL